MATFAPFSCPVLDGAVDAEVVPGPPAEVVLDDVEELRHLGEEEDLVARALERGEDAVEEAWARHG